MCPAMPSDDEDALRLQRQIRRAVAETCGPAGIRELPAQGETARLPSSSSAVSNSLKQGILSPRRHSARASGRCPCAARWDAVVTASCEAFCEKNKLFLENKSSVTTTASCEAFCEGAWRSGRWYHPGVTTTASCEAFCEETFFVNGMQFESQPQPAVKPSVSAWHPCLSDLHVVTTTASCEAFCEQDIPLL